MKNLLPPRQLPVKSGLPLGSRGVGAVDVSTGAF
jgi:hypothetical protein